MKIFFCPECGGYSLGPATKCDECQADLPEDSWAEVTEEELQQLEYVEDFHLPADISTWEYDVVKLKSDAEEGGLSYTTSLLKKMGDKGWELVNITPLSNHKDGPKYGVFKRVWEESTD